MMVMMSCPGCVTSEGAMDRGADLVMVDWCILLVNIVGVVLVRRVSGLGV